MNKNMFKLLAVLLLISAWENPVLASELWEVNKRKLPELSCQEQWSILWPEAKKGNLEARQTLFVMVFPPPELEPLEMPRVFNDRLMVIRDGFILGAHSLAADPSKNIPEIREELINLAHLFGLSKTISGRRYLECLSGGVNNCVDIAISGGIIPTFEKYSEEIEILLSNGLKASCHSK